MMAKNHHMRKSNTSGNESLSMFMVVLDRLDRRLDLDPSTQTLIKSFL